MQRRTLIKAGITATLAGLAGIPKSWACACGGTTYYMPASSLGTSVEEPIEALFDREYGIGVWEFSQDMALELRHPEIAENEQVIPINVNLSALPQGMQRCTQVDVYRRTTISIVTRIDSHDYRSQTVNMRITRCHPANILPMEYGTRYRGSHGKARLFAALSFLTTSAERKVLVYQHPQEVRATGCSGTVYVQDETQ